MEIHLHRFLFLFYLSLFSLTALPSIAQRKTWPSAIDYKLKGHIHYWVMKTDTGIIRQQSYNNNGILIKDTYRETPQTYTPPEYLPEKLRSIYEAIYPDRTEYPDSNNNRSFNERGQLLKSNTAFVHQINTFNARGKISVHKQTQSITQTRAMNTPDRSQPPRPGTLSKIPFGSTYTFTDTTGEIVIYKYNGDGFIIEFESYYSDPYKNLRMVYSYDKNNNLIESKRYDWYNIPSKLMSENTVKKIIAMDIDSTFSIDDLYNNYWSQGRVVSETWKYNSRSEKTEYIAGFVADPSFRATWEYDDAGNLMKETQYDVYHNTIRSLIEFDKQGNVIKETDCDYWANKDNNYYYRITYY